MPSTAKSKAFYLLSLICMIYMFDYADRHIMSSLLPYIREDWNLQDANLGLLNSIVSLTVGLFAIPLSILVDRWSRKKMISIMVFSWSLATFLCGFATNYTHLLFLRALVGLGEAAYAAAAVAMISKVFPKKYRGRYIGFYNASAPLGAGLGMVVGGYVAKVINWQSAFGFVAIPGMILAVMFWFVQDYKTQPLPSDEDDVERSSDLSLTLKAIVGLLKIKTLWLVYIAYMLVIAVNSSVMVWASSFFVRFYALDKSLAASISGGLAVMVLFGAPMGGIIADKWSLKYKNAKLAFSAIASAVSSLSLFIGIYVNNFTVCLISLGIFGITTVAFLAPATAVIQEVVHSGMRAVAFSLNVMLMNVLGSFLAPFFVGVISDYYGSDEFGLRYALLFLPILGVLASLLFLSCKKFYYYDLSRNHLLYNCNARGCETSISVQKKEFKA